MPQGSYKKSKCDVPKQKDKHKGRSPGLKKGGNAYVCPEICYKYYKRIFQLQPWCGWLNRLRTLPYLRFARMARKFIMQLGQPQPGQEFLSGTVVKIECRQSTYSVICYLFGGYRV